MSAESPVAKVSDSVRAVVASSRHAVAVGSPGEAASAACALFAVVVPEGWIGLLGLIPLGLGLRGLWMLRRGEEEADVEDAESPRDMQRFKALAVAGVTVAMVAIPLSLAK